MDAISQLNRALVGRYDVEREVGRGGMATVYLAHDTRHDRSVALKVLNPDLGAVLGVDRFLSEIRVAANLQHSNLLPLFDSGDAEGLLFYAMPFVEGESLRARLTREKQLPVDEAVRLTTAIAGALDYAHRHGVIHRDLKPENILLHEGQPLVADFGIALAVTNAGGKRITESGLSVGTPQYMSPEQAAGDRTIDARSDIYSLGAVMYEMLTGEPPHLATTAQALVARVLTDTPRPVRTSRPSVPEHVEQAIERALEKVPADRFAKAQDFASALEGPRAESRTRSGGVMRSARPDWKSRMAFPVAVVAIVATVAAVWGWAKVSRARESEVLHVPISLDEPSRLRYPWANTLMLSPDGKKIVYSGTGYVPYLMDLATGRNTRLGLQDVGSFAFSPSSDSVAVRTGGWHGNLHLVSLATGQAKLLTDSARNVNFSWGNDGWIYHGDEYLGISRTRSDGSRRERLARPDTGQAKWMLSGSVEALPNGKGLIYARRPWMGTDMAQSEIYALDIATGAAHVVARGVQARFMRTGHLLVVQADGSLLAAPFDISSLKATGEFVKVLDNVEVLGAPDGGGSFSLSEAGDLLYVTAAHWEEDRVVYVDRAGRAVREDSGWGGWIRSVAVTSDGRNRVASVMRRQRPENLWMRGAGQREPSELTSAQSLDAWPTFIKGGGAVAFVGPRDGGNWDLYFVPVDGASKPARVLDRPGDILTFDIAPDGQSVAFCEKGKSADVGFHRFAADTLTTMLLATPSNECSPVLSPSGEWVAYVSDEFGRAEVYVMPVRGATPARRISTEGASDGLQSLHWSRDGREILFLGADGGMFAVPVGEGATPSFGSPKRLFGTGELVWRGTMTADEQQFLMIRENLRAPGRVVLIRNFAKVLREKLGK